ncbi:hypothetical protein ABT150_54750, partial [Streptomyces mirabilis]|uniref:hypothetical protein n=1 Tax=Streptomyces mirabilis TaxID=68239 RepID=UPI0033314CA9
SETSDSTPFCIMSPMRSTDWPNDCWTMPEAGPGLAGIAADRYPMYRWLLDNAPAEHRHLPVRWSLLHAGRGLCPIKKPSVEGHGPRQAG